jgi:uncharacterized protein (TIGR03790 family)
MAEGFFHMHMGTHDVQRRKDDFFRTQGFLLSKLTPILSLLAVLIVSFHAQFVLALGAGNVLVLYRAGDSDSAAIANYYAQQHPGVRLLGLNNVPAGEQIGQADYLNIIRPQVLAGLDSSVDAIVTTKGLPLRIYNDPPPSSSFPYNYTDPQGVPRTIYSSSFKPFSSLESELSRIDTFSTWEQLGDQTYWAMPSGSNPSKNPYFKRNATFSHSDPANGQLRLSTRLDGFTVADVQASIDRAQRVFIVPFGQKVVVDNSPTAVAATVTSMQSLVNNVLVPRGQSYLYDAQTAPVLTTSGPVIGYVSHGTNDGSGQLTPTYLRTQLNFNLAKGAVMQTWESYNGYTFVEGDNRGQGLIGDWIRAGGTAGVAHVEEPGASLSNVTNEDRMFQMLLDGYTWAEAAWNATPQVSYVNTVIGDPLMVWHPWLPGDANLDGTVNLGDYSQLRANWLHTGTFAQGDFNGDGMVNLADYSILKSNWLHTALGSSSLLTVDATLTSIPSAPPIPIPEPGSSLLIVTICSTVVLRRGRKTA